MVLALTFSPQKGAKVNSGGELCLKAALQACQTAYRSGSNLTVNIML